MITPAYCLTMARYNAWQNRCMREAMESLSDAALRQDRGAFFGSILKTANHILWADQMWMSRLADTPKPDVSLADSVDLCPTLPVWTGERFRLDGRLILWAEKLHALDLLGDLSWYSGAMQRDMIKPRALAILHMFNHQIHHRGQVHAMLTEAGVKTQDTDLFAMPEAGPWL